MATEERWVAVEEVAAHLQVAKESVYRWVESKGFPAHRVGRLLRFKLSEVDAWVKNSSRSASNSAQDPTPASEARTNRSHIESKGAKKRKHE